NKCLNQVKPISSRMWIRRGLLIGSNRRAEAIIAWSASRLGTVAGRETDMIPRRGRPTAAWGDREPQNEEGVRLSVRQRRLLMTLVLAGTVAVSAIAVSSASAVIKTLPNGQAVSYEPLRSASSGPSPFDLVFDNMDYNGGPVMPSNTDYMLMWSPTGLGAY